MKIGIRTMVGLGAISLSLVLSGFAAARLGGEHAVLPPEEGFVLREYCGKVGIFLPGAAEPVRITNIETKNLPGVDIAELKKGIFTKNDEDLAQLLEDLGS